MVYLLMLGVVLYLLTRVKRQGGESENPYAAKPARSFKPKRSPMEPWVQVYETAEMNEARSLQARLQEEEVECVVYEQGKKDIYGNFMKGIGLAVPKTAMNLAQKIINRLLS